MAFLIWQRITAASPLLSFAGRAGYPFNIIIIVEIFVAFRCMASQADGSSRYPRDCGRFLRCSMELAGAVAYFAADLL